MTTTKDYIPIVTITNIMLTSLHTINHINLYMTISLSNINVMTYFNDVFKTKVEVEGKLVKL